MYSVCHTNRFVTVGDGPPSPLFLVHKKRCPRTAAALCSFACTHVTPPRPRALPASCLSCLQTRIALSILVSCLIYNHPITELGLLGMLIVFGAVFYRINRRLQGKRLVEWEGMDDSKGMDMFHEWHEHLDL